MSRQEVASADHEQVPSRVLLGVHLDSGVALVIDWLNEHGCETLYSCEGSEKSGPWEPGCGYIMFKDASALELARGLLRSEAEDSGHLRLAVRIAGLPCQKFGDDLTVLADWGMQWRYEMSPASPTKEDPGSERSLTATVRCSREDLLELSSLLPTLLATTGQGP